MDTVFWVFFRLFYDKLSRVVVVIQVIGAFFEIGGVDAVAFALFDFIAVHIQYLPNGFGGEADALLGRIVGKAHFGFAGCALGHGRCSGLPRIVHLFYPELVFAGDEVWAIRIGIGTGGACALRFALAYPTVPAKLFYDVGEFALFVRAGPRQRTFCGVGLYGGNHKGASRFQHFGVQYFGTAVVFVEQFHLHRIARLQVEVAEIDLERGGTDFVAGGLSVYAHFVYTESYAVAGKRVLYVHVFALIGAFQRKYARGGRNGVVVVHGLGVKVQV